MRQLARLAANTSQAGRLALAEYLGANSERLYFNDRIWNQYQSYGLIGEQEVGFNAQERERTLANERRLRDQQEELWRAYRIARELAEQGPANAVTMRAAELGVSVTGAFDDEEVGVRAGGDLLARRATAASFELLLGELVAGKSLSESSGDESLADARRPDEGQVMPASSRHLERSTC